MVISYAKSKTIPNVFSIRQSAVAIFAEPEQQDAADFSDALLCQHPNTETLMKIELLYKTRCKNNNCGYTVTNT